MPHFSHRVTGQALSLHFSLFTFLFSFKPQMHRKRRSFFLVLFLWMVAKEKVHPKMIAVEIAKGDWF